MGGICWLASYPKSGNTWVRLFLANLFANLPEPVNINTLKNFTFGDNRGDLYETVAGRPLDSLSQDDVNRLRPQVHRLIAGARPETIFVKTHQAVGLVDGVATISPEVTQGAVYIIRNPLDTAVSYANHVSAPLEEAVRQMADPANRLAGGRISTFSMLTSWSNHVLSWVEAPGLTPHVMRYEDMIAKPHKAFGAFCRFLGLPVTRERLDKAIRFSSFDTLQDQEARLGFRERPPTSGRFFRKGQVGAWREDLPDALARQVIADHDAVMRRFGYLKADGSPVF
jgi:hypothetical protein